MSTEPIQLTLNEDTRLILGRPNFACRAEAQMLRNEGWTIARKSEEEQAAVLLWMINLYLKHGAQWKEEGTKFVEAHVARMSVPRINQGGAT